jgi:hypothetical protein
MLGDLIVGIDRHMHRHTVRSLDALQTTNWCVLSKRMCHMCAWHSQAVHNWAARAYLTPTVLAT